MRALTIPLFLSCVAGSALSAPASLPSQCTALISRAFPDWRATAVPTDAAAWAKSKGWNPVVTTGDFDGNGRSDWATIGSSGGKQKVVLCLSGQGGRSLAVAEDNGCTDLVFSFKRRTKLPNYESGKEELLPRDSVATSCFEKSGRTFVYEQGVFRVFFHSD